MSVGLSAFHGIHVFEWECVSFPSNNERCGGGSVVAGGIGDYGSDESEDDEARSPRGSDSSDTDDEELHHRIRVKQDAFRRKEQEMQEKQAQELARGRSQVHSFKQNVKNTLFYFCLTSVV